MYISHRWAVCLAIILLLAPFASAQINVSGYLEGTLYPPHNEFDPNPRIPFSERPVAAYGLEPLLRLSASFFPRLFVFGNPRFYFGDRRPQINYGWSARPLAVNALYGIGFQAFRHPNIECRLSHGEWKNMGGFVGSDNLLWSGLQVRWTFGDTTMN